MSRMEKERAKIRKDVAELIPVIGYDQENGCYKMKNERYMDLVQINSKDLVTASADEVEYDCLKFCKMYKLYEEDLKLVVMNFPSSTKTQQEYLKRRKEKTANAVFKRYLQRQIDELAWLEKHNTTREFYLMLFADDSAEAIVEERRTLWAVLHTGRDGLIGEIREEKKHQILYRMNNKCSQAVSDRRKKEGLKKAPGYDAHLLEKIQPRGGITFRDPRYVNTGSGYEACIHIYEFPRNIDDFWLSKVCNINNTVVTVDISTYNVIEVKKNINRSMKEQEYRYMEANDFRERYDAKQRYQEMERLYDEINAMGEVIKLLHIRIFVPDRSLAGLEVKIKNIMAKLESNGFGPAIFLNETKKEWASMYKPYREQQEDVFFPDGQAMTSKALAAGNPFHFSSLEDPTGDLLGKTPCGGNVLFDEFTKTSTRLYYNSLAVGTMGSGKSTLLKKRVKSNAVRGNYIRIFDVSGEFTRLTKTLGGKVIRLDGTNGILNPLEILKADEDEGLSFIRHISKVSVLYKFLTEGTADTQEIIMFEELLRELYQSFGIGMEDGRMKQKITGLPADRYPVFSDLLEFIEQKISRIQGRDYGKAEFALASRELEGLDRIRRVVSSIVCTYGMFLDGHTSIDNILDEQIVSFDISTVKEIKPAVFDALIFNMVSLCWDNCVTNGRLMLDMLNRGEIELQDVARFLMVIDESHRWINAKKRHAVELIQIYLREARKYFGGIILASQSIRDYVPEGSGAEEINELKKIFELTQYKFIFHQESNVLPLLDRIFENTLTGSQRNKIPKLEMGETILCISSDRNLEFKVYLTKEEEKIFQGGV